MHGFSCLFVDVVGEDVGRLWVCLDLYESVYGRELDLADLFQADQIKDLNQELFCQDSEIGCLGVHSSYVGMQADDLTKSLDVHFCDGARYDRNNESVSELEQADAKRFDQVQKMKVVYFVIFRFSHKISVFRPRAIFERDDLDC